LGLFSSKEFHQRPYLFKDMLSEFIVMQDIVDDFFQKVACKPVTLHNEFVQRASQKRYQYISQKTFSYTDEELKHCKQVENYQVLVPLTGQQLVAWAEYLRNCMVGYFDLINQHETTIYCFFKNNNLQFAVEISDEQIIQASGKYNRELTDEENLVLQKWFKHSFMYNNENENAA